MIDDTYVFCFQSQKGGVGKTTLACHFARAITWYGKPTILIDTDPQGSAQDWMAAREEESPFPVVGFTRDKLHKDIRQIVNGYKFAIIDSPPRTTQVARSALLCSDALIIPLSPSVLDVWALSDTLQLVDEAKEYNESLKIGIAINREIGNTQISKAVDKELQKTGIKVFESHIKQRVAYAEVMGIGKTVMEVEPEGVAAMDFLNLFIEVVEWSEGHFRYANPRDHYRDSVRPYLGQSNLKSRLIAEYKVMARRLKRIGEMDDEGR